MVGHNIDLHFNVVLLRLRLRKPNLVIKSLESIVPLFISVHVFKQGCLTFMSNLVTSVDGTLGNHFLCKSAE